MDATEVATLPELTSRHHITDAHLLALALQHGLKFATLDDALCRTPWAAGIAINPLGPAPAEP